GQQLGGGDRDLLGVTATGEEGTDLVADVPARHTLAEFGDHSGAFEAQDVARPRGRRVEAAPLQQVGAVDRGRRNIEKYVPGRQVRVGLLGPPENFWTTGFGGDDCIHVFDAIACGAVRGRSLRSWRAHLLEATVR